jgi:oxygen-independent coproporphyrinogen-3 oxidase
MTGLYLHIPFCARKCPYCDFFSVSYHKDTVNRYVAAILRNIESCGLTETVDSIYFGGGTPSLLSAAQVADILEACSRRLHLSTSPEITFEFNPSGKRAAYLHDIRSAGINRLSIGIQSFSDTHLHMLGRTHSAEDGLRTVHDAQRQGFDNISCDLMLAWQTETELAQTLSTLTALPITHISAYLLQIEEGTPFSRDTSLLSILPDDDTAADRYLQTVYTLEYAGFLQYEVSNFARPGFESRHNMKYWQCEPYLGIGAGAHSCCDGRRFCVPEDMEAFCQAPVQPTVLIDPSPCGREERLMLALRTVHGAEAAQLSEAAKDRIAALRKAGYLRILPDGRISLTPEGFAVSNSVIGALVEM